MSMLTMRQSRPWRRHFVGILMLSTRPFSLTEIATSQAPVRRFQLQSVPLYMTVALVVAAGNWRCLRAHKEDFRIFLQIGNTGQFRHNFGLTSNSSSLDCVCPLYHDYCLRNDADTIGVRSGCTFTGFTGTSFDGDQMVATAGTTDK